MAKKKVSDLGKPIKKPEQTLQAPPTAMDEVSEKLESLKSLNGMLLKETVERRQQVDSLMQSNGCLEMELIQFRKEKIGLESDLVRLGDCSVMMEIERDLVFAFVDARVKEQFEVIEKERDGFGREKLEIDERLRSLEGEMMRVVKEKCGIEKMVCEKESVIGVLKQKLSELVGEVKNEKVLSDRLIRGRDEMRYELDVQIEETNVLKKKLIEAEGREKVIKGEVEELRVNYERVMEEKSERERKIESIIREKECIESSAVELNQVIGELKSEIVEMGKEKETVEGERNAQMVKRNELENAVSLLNDIVLSLQVEGEKLRGNVAVLEKKCNEGEEKEKQMVMEVGVLVEEKVELEKSLKRLIGEKKMIMKDLDNALRQLDEVKDRVEEIAKEKSVVEEIKDKGVSDIVELKKHVAELKDTIHSLEESCKGKVEKIGELESEISVHRAALDCTTNERNEARKNLNEEKASGMKLMEKIAEKENTIEETQKVVEKMMDQKSNLMEQKKDLESRFEVLKEDLAVVENKLLEAQKEHNNLQAKVRLADANSEMILKMLRNTATLVSQSKDKSEMDDQMKAGEEIKAHVAELEAIKNAFKSRESTVEEMKRQMELLKHSEAVHKKRSFWTFFTSATTIFAAASVAYVTRGH